MDLFNGKIYWADRLTDTIARSNLDGTQVEPVVTGNRAPHGIALDVLGDKMYWADGGQIRRANLDGTSVEDIVTGLKVALGLAIDLADEKVYWVDEYTQKVQRANFDGSNVEDLITDGVGIPVGVALNLIEKKIYWTDSGAKKIQQANLDGTEVKEVLFPQGNPKGIVLDVKRGKIYWAERIGINNIDNIVEANLDGTEMRALFGTTFMRPNFVTLALEPTIPNLVFPDNAAVNVPTNVTLNWSAENEKNLYKLQISNAPDFSSLFVDESEISDTLFIVNSLSNSTTYYWHVKAINVVGTSEWSDTFSFTTSNITDVELVNSEVPNGFELKQNYPNPFNPETTINYQLPEATDVRVEIYNIMGQKITTLVNRKQPAGDYSVKWQPQNLPSGLYFIRMQTPQITQIRKILMLK